MPNNHFRSAPASSTNTRLFSLSGELATVSEKYEWIEEAIEAEREMCRSIGDIPIKH